MRMLSIFCSCSQQTPSYNPSSSNISLKQIKNISVIEPDPQNVILVKDGLLRTKSLTFIKSYRAFISAKMS